MRRFTLLSFVSLLLAASYAILASIYQNFFVMRIYTWHSLGLCIILSGLFVAAFFVTRMYSWARLFLVWGNLCAGVYGLFLAFYFKDFVPAGYVILFASTGIFFNLKSIRAHFDFKDHWECILIVDDDLTSIKTVRPMLVNEGYAVITASSGEEGLLATIEKKPDLILLDVILPGLKGRDVCRKLKENEATKKIPVIFLTAKDSQDDIEAEMAAGAQSHLTKPVNRRKLLSTVRKYLKS